jgi:Uma2 family endonuclease
MIAEVVTSATHSFTRGFCSIAVNVGMKLLEFHQLSWRERFSSSGLRSQFLGSWSRKSTRLPNRIIAKKSTASFQHLHDVTVSCDENEEDTALHAPRVVFEVLSPSTEAIDRTEKLEAYRELPSIEDYVLVSSERQVVEVHHRDRKRNCWITRIYGPGDSVNIESLSAEFLMDEIYERTRFKQK